MRWSCFHSLFRAGHPMRLLPLILQLLLTALPAAAQPGLDDCTQGYAKPPYVDPRSYNAMCMPELGTMAGNGVVCKYGSEDFGRDIAPVGDVDHDGLRDWVVSHARCDTIFGFRVPIELLLYRGVKAGLPLPASGRRIGPSELGSATEFLAAGDWDGDGNQDIATMIYLYGDTTGGNTQGYHTARLAIFWGSPNGDFSLDDTTRLSNGTDDLWINILRAVSTDFDHDGVEDLLAWGGSGIIQGVSYTTPIIHIFRGHRDARWGRKTVGKKADWHWWAPPPFNYLGLTDQDGDGALDVVFYHNESAGTGHTSVLYGGGSALPDTTDVETIDLKLPNGHFSLFSDITGDRVPELLLTCGTEQQIKVFIGLKGQRLLQQFGSGNDPAQPGNPEWWGRPWAKIWLPNKIHQGWIMARHEIFDAGDAARDGVRDIWAVSEPFVIIYNTGVRLDSLQSMIRRGYEHLVHET